MKLGSLFDGSGGFPLAGAIHGIMPMWAAEIEAYPIKVTKARFPQMKHLGSVLDVGGAEVEPVDIITFGSPCQDLSVAGKQAGLHKGERSNLFFEAIRIIKEMREATNGKYPRIAVWENVPGAYSSNKGEDFRAVLEAFAQINDEAADVPRSASGKWNPAGAIVGNGWSVAWRTFDAQYWGVPQRRKRIYLIADFGSERAGEILFEQEGSYRDTEKGGTAREGTSGNAEGSAGRGVLFEPMSALEENWAESSVKNALRANASKSSHAVCFQQNQREEVRSLGEKTGAIAANGGAHQTNYVCEQIDLIRESRGAFEAYEEDAQAAGSLKQSDFKGTQVVCFKERAGCPGGGKGILCGDKPVTLSTLTDQAVCYSLDRASFNQGINAQYKPQIEEELASALVAKGPSAVCYPIDSHQQDSRFKVCADGISPTLPGQMGTGGNNGPMVLTYRKTAHPRNADEAQGWEPTDKADTLNVFDNSENRTPTAVVERMRGFGDYVEDGTFSAIKARDYKDAVDLVRIKTPRRYIIRRLTPLECVRLQGLPDGWLDGVDGSDSAKYKMLGNGIAMPNAIYVIGCAKKLIEEG